MNPENKTLMLNEDSLLQDDHLCYSVFGWIEIRVSQSVRKGRGSLVHSLMQVDYGIQMSCCLAF